MKFIIPTLLSFLLFSSCKDSSYKDQSAILEYDGKALSELYCASCHSYPEPSTLDKDTWKNYMLPRMGYMYGIYSSRAERDQLFEKNEGGDLVRARNLFPSERILDSLTWNAIQGFYLANAPDSLPSPKSNAITKCLPQFQTIISKQKVNIPSSTMARFSDDGLIFLGDAMTRSFSIFSENLELLSTGNVQEGAVSVFEDKEIFWLTVMGSFSPTDAPKGMVATLSKDPSVKSEVILSNLQRPVHSSYFDLDNDGDQDIIVCEFGKWTGALSLFRNNEDGYQRETLNAEPGAIRSYVRDMNNDGYEDVIALFAQGNEGVDIYYNDGKANFKKERVLQFSPSMGGSFMELIDYNDDGYIDILYTAGDNADYKPVLKPWHGVYVFVNDGSNNFSQELFLHLNGAYNAIVNDFDLDGDKDIAAISFFPDWANTPEESFVYFENKGNANFSRSTFPEVNKGRWAVMDGADYDKDGDVDLILGSLAFEVIPKLGFVEKWMKEGIPFIILRNTKFE